MPGAGAMRQRNLSSATSAKGLPIVLIGSGTITGFEVSPGVVFRLPLLHAITGMKHASDQRPCALVCEMVTQGARTSEDHLRSFDTGPVRWAGRSLSSAIRRPADP